MIKILAILAIISKPNKSSLFAKHQQFFLLNQFDLQLKLLKKTFRNCPPTKYHFNFLGHTSH